MLNTLEFFDLAVTFIGINRPVEADCEQLDMFDEKRMLHKKIILKDDVACGFVGVGQIKNAEVYRTLIKTGAKLTGVKSRLLNDDFSGLN